MISLTQFLTESVAADRYGVLLDHIEFKKIPDLAKLISLIKEGIIEANSRYKVLRIEAIENLNKQTQQYDADRLAKALEYEEKRVIAYMQTKPGIMKRSEEKRQKYIDDKLEKFKASWRGPMLSAAEYDEHNIRFAWHSYIHTESTYHDLVQYNIDKIDLLAKRIAEDIDDKRNDSTWSHLIGINIAVDNSGLTHSFAPQFHIVPMFDEETEKTLSDEVRGFGEYVSREYASGRYMGD